MNNQAHRLQLQHQASGSEISSGSRFPCDFPECPESFTRRSDRVRHRNSVHSLLAKIFCSFEGCTYGTVRKDKILLHTRRHLRSATGKTAKRRRCAGRTLSSRATAHASLNAERLQTPTRPIQTESPPPKSMKDHEDDCRLATLPDFLPPIQTYTPTDDVKDIWYPSKNFERRTGDPGDVGSGPLEACRSLVGPEPNGTSPASSRYPYCTYITSWNNEIAAELSNYWNNSWEGPITVSDEENLSLDVLYEVMSH